MRPRRRSEAFGEICADPAGCARQRVLFRGVFKVFGRLSGSKSAAAHLRDWRSRWIQRTDAIRSAACDLTGKDDAGARTRPSCPARASLPRLHNSEGTPVPLGTLAGTTDG